MQTTSWTGLNLEFPLIGTSPRQRDADPEQQFQLEIQNSKPGKVGMRETEAVFTAVSEAARSGREVVLATIVRTRGSTPRGVGSRMLVDPEQGLVGTVGGGCGEAQVVESAREVLQTGTARVITIDLTDDLSGWSPAVCGGVFEVLLEPLSSRPLGG